MRIALDDAAPLYRDAPEAQEARLAGSRFMDVFMEELMPDVAEETRLLASDLIATTINAVGKHFSEKPRTDAEITAYAKALADMLCAYLATLVAR